MRPLTYSEMKCLELAEELNREFVYTADEWPNVQVGDVVKVMKTIAEEYKGEVIRYADPNDLALCVDKGRDGCPNFTFLRNGRTSILDDPEYVVLSAEALKDELLTTFHLLWQCKSEMAHMASAMKEVNLQKQENELRSHAMKRGKN